jgi:hypothetical protein
MGLGNLLYYNNKHSIPVDCFQLGDHYNQI